MFKNAKWVKSPENRIESCYDFYKKLTFEKKIKKAILNISAMGMYRAYLNGKRIGEELFTPYWTEYNKRLQYQTYDVTDLLESSAELSIVCAEGWAVGYVRCGAEHRNHYADNISLIFSLWIMFEDGTEDFIESDESVEVRTSQIISSSIYHGEFVDKTAEIRKLGNALYDEAVITELIPQEGEKVVEHERIYPVKLLVTSKGERIIDFGQNLSGYVELIINGHQGERISISHAEVLDCKGNFYTDNLRSARQKNTYVLSGEGTEIFKPTFCWQGFRYIRLDEFPEKEINLDCFCAIAVYSDMERTGWFQCGNSKVNQLYHNVVWGQRCNFIDVPTDCPQRDERLGWTGDAQLFVRTAAINFNVEKFFRKWLRDLSATQYSNGGVGWLVPSGNINLEENISSGWGDAATICPWEIYLAYGNKNILKEQYASMKSWVEYIRNTGNEEYLWLDGKHFGDWLAMDNGDGSYEGATWKEYIASAYYAYSTSILVHTGEILGYDMSEYKELYTNIVKAFQKMFFENELPICHTQTAYAIALCFGLCKSPLKVAGSLAELVRKNGTKMTTGFLGTPYLLHALSENGYSNVAYDLLLQEEFPSWLYSVNHGATTMWEHWDSLKEDGSFWDTNMNSFNHYAYGAVYDWIFGEAAGIKVKPEGAGYEKIIIRPHTDKRLGFLTAGIHTKFGKLQSRWYYKENNIHFEYEIPRGVTAELTLPDHTQKMLSDGTYMFVIKE